MDFEATKDVLLNKKSMVKVQDAFAGEFLDIYQEATEYEQEFMQVSIDQIYKKFYYSIISMGSSITPANILETLALKEKVGSVVFFPKIQMTNNNLEDSVLVSTLDCVTSQKHYMVNDFEKVIEICKEGIKVDRYGIPDDSERKRFIGQLFYDDRHYLNILVLVAISIRYISIFTQGKKILAITTQKAKKLSEMSNAQKIEVIIDGVIENCLNSMNISESPFKGILTKDMLYDVLKDPSKFRDLIDHINEKIGFDKNFLEDIISKEVYLDVYEIEELIQNNPAAPLVRLASIQLDVYFITPLGYYMQLIKPIYDNVYNIALELGHVFGALNDSFNYGRNQLFAIPSEFDLTVLGEEIFLDGRKSIKKQNIPKSYNDTSFLKLFDKREKYLNDELINFLGSAQAFCDSYEDDDYDDFEDDDYDDFDDDDELIVYKKNDNDKIIDMFSYKRKAEDSKIKKNTKSGKSNHDSVYALKIKDFYAKRRWVQVEIGGNSTLDDLSNIVSSEFDLEDGHLYSYFMSGKFWDRDSEYSHPLAKGHRNASKFAIGSLGITQKSKFVYIYDYGDEIRFEIECISIEQADNGGNDKNDNAKVIKRSKWF